MIQTVKNYLEDENLGPVKVARVEQWDNGECVGVTGFEVGFRESSPVNRDARFIRLFKELLCCALILTFFYFLVWTPAYIELGLKGYIVGWFKLAFVIGLLIVTIFVGRAVSWPFRYPVSVLLSPAQDMISIFRRGKLEKSVTLSEVMGVSVEPHPGLGDALIRYEESSNSRTRDALKRYRGSECLYLIMGTGGVPFRKVEVAAFKEKKANSSQTAMRVRAAIEAGWRMAQALLEQSEALASPQSNTHGISGQRVPMTTGGRRRRGKIE